MVTAITALALADLVLTEKARETAISHAPGTKITNQILPQQEDRHNELQH